MLLPHLYFASPGKTESFEMGKIRIYNQQNLKGHHTIRSTKKYHMKGTDDK